jgi:DNA-binding transcriptional ArsR family regulator
MFHKTLFSLRGEDMRVELDKKSLFALASDTRLDILRSLQPMRRTVSQLSEALDIDKAAVHRHLKKMEEGGLVKRFEDHGFVYYGLSWKARDLLSPNENTRIIILLSASWILCLAIIFLVVLGTTNNGTVLSPAEWESPTRADGSSNQYYMRETVFGYTASWLLWAVPAGALLACTAIMVAVGLRTHIKPKQKTRAIEKRTQ